MDSRWERVDERKVEMLLRGNRGCYKKAGGLRESNRKCTNPLLIELPTLEGASSHPLHHNTRS